ncbi:MAG: hypothetical protein H7A09_07925 [Oceanospirillaceae bacterium]|nr:hypothetical protein [Oceanospirillaceae bacterium]MCP5335367.1 hypothetical protein [Oceanospirillaceae bacterium]
MARGRNDARKKPETSSSVSEGRVWEVFSQKEETGFKKRLFHHQCNKKVYCGSLSLVHGWALERLCVLVVVSSRNEIGLNEAYF